MFLETKYFNNGYGCSCCREDWTGVQTVKELPSFSSIIMNDLDKFIDNIYEGGQVGIAYEQDGEFVFGVEPGIYKVGGRLYISKGDSEDFLYKDKHSKDGLTKEELIKELGLTL